MNLGRWFSQRSPDFIRRRAGVLVKRYGLTPAPARDRIERTLRLFEQYGCRPTFPTPGRVVERSAPFIRAIQEAGAEIAVHSYDHVDLRGYAPDAACRQLLKGVQTFERFGIAARGFRCPYLSCSDELMQALPPGLFTYSSNQAIGWQQLLPIQRGGQGTVFDTIDAFYRPQSAADFLCVPQTRAGLVEIPVCVPDDLQLHDGLQLDAAGIGNAWTQILDQIYARGELFVLVFHPEAADDLGPAFVKLLEAASSRHPPVWITRLREVADWWRDKSGFHCRVSASQTGLCLSFCASPRATLLARGLDGFGVQEPWDGIFKRVRSAQLEVPARPCPLVGVAPDVPLEIKSMLQEQGFILDTGETASECACYLDYARAAGLTQVELVNWIEKSAGPLVKFGRWPEGARAALCLTGDLDALSLLDYGSRIFVR